jgi:hypothetical protein
MNKQAARNLFLIGIMATSTASLQVAAEDPELPYRYSEEWSVVSAPGPAGPYQPVNIDPRVPGSALLPLPVVRAPGEIAPPPAESMAMPEPELVAPPQPEIVAVPDTDMALPSEAAEQAEPGSELASAPDAGEQAEPESEQVSEPDIEMVAEPEGITEPFPDVNADTMANPPAAGRVEMPSAAVQPPSPAAALMRPPGPGYYQPMRPAVPAYGYPGRSGYPGQGWSQGYRMPPTGYYRAPESRPREPEIPPPPVYEELQRRSGSSQLPR